MRLTGVTAGCGSTWGRSPGGVFQIFTPETDYSGLRGLNWLRFPSQAEMSVTRLLKVRHGNSATVMVRQSDACRLDMPELLRDLEKLLANSEQSYFDCILV